MKYFLIVAGVIATGLFMGYKYINYKYINDQEDSFRKLATQQFQESPRTFPDSVKMNDRRFWALISESKAKYPSNFDAQMSFLTQQLSSLSNEEIIGFEATLKEKIIELWDYKVKAFYQILIDDYLSTDGFIYFRFWIVSNGSDFYKMSLTDPDQLADKVQSSYEGERLMVVADEAFELKNGTNSGLQLPRDITAEVSYDFGNYKMSGQYIALNEFKDKFPRLVKKF